MGIPTLIKTLTASGDDQLDFVDGGASVVFDSTYDEYMFVFTDIHPSNEDAGFSMKTSINGGTGYGVATTTTAFQASHTEADGTEFQYEANRDLAQATTFQVLAHAVGASADESCAGIFHIFNPASTTYVKHFYSRFSSYGGTPGAWDWFIAGYVNTTSAVDAIRFGFGAGTVDAGVIQMYGIA